MPSFPMRLAAVIAIGVSAALASPPAAAQQGGLAQLRQVFADGRQLEDKGHWAEALDKFKEVAATKMTPQVRFHIALCEENMGKLVSAMKGFELAAAEGTAAGSSAVEVPPAATQHAEALRGRIAKLHVEVHGKLTTSKIVLDDNPLGDKDLDADVDPGPHVVEVRDASGKVTYHKEVTLAEKGSDKVTVTVGDPDDAPPPVPTQPSPGPSRVPAYVTGSIGLAVLATSGILYGVSASNIATVAAHCRDPVNHIGCDPGYQAIANQGQALNWAADAFLGVGLAGVATGTVLFFVLGSKKAPGTPPPAATMRLVPAGTGLKVIGVF